MDNTPSQSGGMGIPLSAVGNIIVSTRRWLVLGGLVAAMALVLPALLQHRTYTVSASFAPQTLSKNSTAANLAAQLGVALPAGDATNSPNFYVSLLKARVILEQVVDARYLPPAVSLPDALQITAQTPQLRRERTIEQLRTKMKVVLDPLTSIVQVSVPAPSATLAQQVVEQLLRAITKFNLENRRSQAARERDFVAQQFTEGEQDLHTAEEQLRRFLETNRGGMSSPQLALERDRLAREVAMRQQRYTSLAQAYDQAKIDAARDSPTIFLIDPPEVPAQPDGRGLVKRASLGFALGFFVVLLGAFAHWYWHDGRHVA